MQNDEFRQQRDKCIQYYCRMQNETFWLFSVLFQLESSVTSLKYKKHTTLFIVSILSFCSNTLYLSSIEQWSPKSNKSQIPLQNVCCVTTVLLWYGVVDCNLFFCNFNSSLFVFIGRQKRLTDHQLNCQQYNGCTL